MKKILVALTVLHLVLGASIVDVTCPDLCSCQIKDDNLETTCQSYEFIKKLIPKQETKIVRLNINNALLINIDLKLKYLKNLHTLDLSDNKIESLPSQFPYLPKLKNLNVSQNRLENVNFAQLPKNLQEIDLSSNGITNFPKDWSTLKQLKTLHFHDNPIDCDCDNLQIYEQLLKGNVFLSSNLTCFYPKEFHGRLLNSINCTLIKENILNSMLGDESGYGLEDEHEDKSPTADDQEFINAETLTTNPGEDLNEMEGSGDVGSGFDELSLIPIEPIIPPPACYFNCSTPRPVGLNDEQNASPPPNVFEQAKTFFEDILEPEKVNEITKIEETSETTTPLFDPVLKEVDETVNKVDDKGNYVERISTNDTVTGKMERASLESSNNQSVYIIVGLIIAFVAFLLIYFLNKRRSQRKRNQRKRNKSNENGYGEEMKPLGKSVENSKPIEQVNTKLPESTPLLNGQNGKVAEDHPEDKVQSQPEEVLEEVELRKSEKDTLTPQPERVTIKAGELPDSIPKTPLRVHRQLNSDGEIVTTTVSN